MRAEKRYFEEVPVGETRTSYGRTITESDIHGFAGLEGHYGELHTNKAYAETTPYGRRIAHGALNVTLIQGLMASTPWNFQTYALYGFDKIRFVNPVFIGDTVHLEAEVINKEVRNEETGVITINCELTKEDGTTATVLKWLLLVHRES
ncbi:MULTISPECIES: MaoC/PaaZ C-terminal domain-containing protein [unclassified Haladaptatus]|uniref:MaoC/PaaZ C-terminal domain-containing protein n=1 Tax=unclassified Haladaptatus TaxID=2622732 RepID=UPI0023E81D5C|nr:MULTISPECIES: MaoC/PaaZ C-terminal domain-containing protein [unclassified Haladaptatus]